jgi:cardiolipin synthase
MLQRSPVARAAALRPITTPWRAPLRTAIARSVPVACLRPHSAPASASPASPAALHCVDHRWSAVRSTLETLGNTTSTYELTPYHETADAYIAMWAAVDAAREYVIWHTYIAKDDAVGQKTVAKLVAAANRGVRVEFLYDCGGNMTGRARLVEPLVAAGATVVRYRPFLPGFAEYFSRLHWHSSPGVRNHRKILVVDDAVAFTGGLNIGCEYAGERAGGTGRFRDSHCMVTGADGVRMLRDACADTLAPRPSAVARALRWRQWATLAVRLRRADAAARVNAASAAAAHVTAEAAAHPTGANAGAAATPPLPSRNTLASARARLRQRWLERGGAAAVGASQPATATPAAASPAPPTSPPAEPQHPQRLEFFRSRGDRLRRSTLELIARRRAVVQRLRLALASRYRSTGAAAAESGGSVAAAAQSVLATHSVLATMLRARRRLASAIVRTRRAASPPQPQATPDGASAPATPSAAGADHAAPAAHSADECGDLVVSVPDAHDVVHHLAVKRSARFAQVLLANPLSENWSLQMALWLVVRRSAARVWVTTPYYLPHRKLVSATIEAARRGVDVRVLTGARDTTDPWIMWYAQQYLTHRLLSAGVKLYEYNGGAVMHAKTVVVDGVWASVGSYNWDILSNKLMEASIAALDPAFAATMERHFELDLARSSQLVEDTFLQRSLLVRVMCRCIYAGLKVAEFCSFRGYGDRDLTSQID